MPILPVIPETITVHLGAPDEAADNVRVPFIDYIKNVASSEIYPTWPESSLRANILAQVTYALNRVYTEWYRSRGYNFDITAVTQYDQKYTPGREIFENVAQIVDGIFNDYVVRQGSIEPLFTQYCNGTTTTCDGLSQWGTVDLAQQGLIPYEILQYYYGEDINIVFDAPTGPNLPSFHGRLLRLGVAGEDVALIQRQLNRIARNYPAMGGPLEVDGIYGTETEAMVRRFQQIFNLAVDGIVGKATWYRIKSIFGAVKGLSELAGEGLRLEEVDRIFVSPLRLGDTGEPVQIIQYYLSLLAYFNSSLPLVSINGVFDEATDAAVRAFQQEQGLAVDGIVGERTWNALTESYRDLWTSLPAQALELSDELYPGIFLTPGQRGPEVSALQRNLIRAAELNTFVPAVTVTGVYDDATEAAVRAVQADAGLDVNGITGPLTWDAVVRLGQPAA